MWSEAPSIRRSCFIVKTSRLPYSSLWQRWAQVGRLHKSQPPIFSVGCLYGFSGSPLVLGLFVPVSRFELWQSYWWVWRMSQLHRDTETITRRRIMHDPKAVWIWQLSGLEEKYLSPSGSRGAFVIFLLLYCLILYQQHNLFLFYSKHNKKIRILFVMISLCKSLVF